MGRIFFWFAGWFTLFLFIISIALTGDAAAQQASPSAAPASSVAPPPTKKPHGKYFEVTLCTYPPGIPKGLVRWAQTQNGSLFTTTVGAFWDALPGGARS